MDDVDETRRCYSFTIITLSPINHLNQHLVLMFTLEFLFPLYKPNLINYNSNISLHHLIAMPPIHQDTHEREILKMV